MNEAANVPLSDEARRQLESFRTKHETQVLTIFFSDLEGSTRQQNELGNVRAAELVMLHRKIFRELLESCRGEEVETAGDSFLVVFSSPSDAVGFAIRMQAAMRREREKTPELLPTRVGIHQGQVVVERTEGAAKGLEIYGLQVSTAARITDLAAGGQVLCSRTVFDDARAILRASDFPGLGKVAWANHGPYRFKGVEESHEVCEVGEEGIAPLKAPPAGSKGWPAEDADEELGWRPSADVTVPGTNWVLQERLGREEAKPGERQSFRGEFGEVWKAYNPGDKSYQVFKFCFRRDRLSALKREARLLKRLRNHRHPNIVQVYDVTEGDRPPFYLEMEYVDGPSMEDWLAENPPLSDRLEVVAQIADALDTVHAAGIYHRDIKPGNILLTRRVDGRLLAQLSDFGLGAAEDQNLLQSLYVSRQEGVAGTWDFIPPEMREGGDASPQSDVFSLGLTLYQLVAGNLRAQAGPGWEGHVESPVLRKDIAKCMAHEPKDRWGSAGALARALRSHDERVELIRLEREREERKERARRRRRLGGVALVLLAIAAAGFFYWYRMPGEVLLSVEPSGANVKIDGRVFVMEGEPVAVRLAPGGYSVHITADDHVAETRDILVERGASREFALALQHHRGKIDAGCLPVGSEIAVDGVAYGSSLRNFELDTGDHELTAWADGHFEKRRTVTIREGDHAREHFWLDRGMVWTYNNPATQGGAFLVGDADGDGLPDILQNELSAMVVLSSADGSVAASQMAPMNNQRGLLSLDLGGEVGKVIVGGWEDTRVGGEQGMDVWVIRVDEPGRTFWRWPGGSQSWRNGGGVWAQAAADLTGDGVQEVAVASSDGSAWVLDGKQGTLLRRVVLLEKRTEHPPAMRADDAGRLVYLSRVGGTSEESGAKLHAFAGGCASAKDGKIAWRKDFGEAHGAFQRDMNGDGTADFVLWRGAGWRVHDGATGEELFTGSLSGGRTLLPYPWVDDIDGDGTKEFLLRSGDDSGGLLAVRAKDGSVAWEGPAGVRIDQHFGEGPLFKRAPGGELLVMLEDSLAAVDPTDGRVAWRVEGRPVGLLVGDWEGDGQDDVFVMIRGTGLACVDGAGKKRWVLRFDLDVRPYMLIPDGDGDGLAEILVHRHAALYGVVRGPRILWKQKGTGPLQATPQVVDGAGDGRLQVLQVGPWSGEQPLRCFDAATGALLWGTDYHFAINRTWPVVDWDGDGTKDIVGVGRAPDPMEWNLVAFRVTDGKIVAADRAWEVGDYYSRPGSGDLDGDGKPDVVIARWDNKDFIALGGRPGRELWVRRTGDHNFGGVACADLDGDGTDDAVAPSLDGRLHSMRGRDGQPVWPPLMIGRGSRSVPSLADLTGDGTADALVVGVDGRLYVVDGREGKMLWISEQVGEGFGAPVAVKGEGGSIILAPMGMGGLVAFDSHAKKERWRTPRGHAILGSPAVADLDGDGRIEVVAGTVRGQVLVFDLETGGLLWFADVAGATGGEDRPATPNIIEGSPALADIDGDGILDILVADHHFELTAISGRGTLGTRE